MQKNTDPESADAPQTRRKTLGNKSKLGAIGAVVLVAIYSFAAPAINERLGINLPEIRTDADGKVQLKERQPPSEETPTTGADPSPPSTNPSATTEPASARTASSADPNPTDSNHEELRYGILREVSPDRYLSLGGLLYTPGSVEGHRLKHLERHLQDMPGRPGPHGVFDGEMAGALKTIDLAYLRARKNQRTTKKVEDGRTIYTVDMGKRVGYVGGREGNRRRKPMARRVRLVLDGNRVITAFPL